MAIRTLIVDDEPLARKRIRKLLEDEDDIAVVGECGGAQEAAEAVRRDAPDLVFLDVAMPGTDGFALIRDLGPERTPVVVFVTAYDEYAVPAFEVRAADYLLKPFDRERFRRALDQARIEVDKRRTAELNRKLSSLLGELEGRERRTDRLAVRSGGRVVFVKTDDIDWIDAAGNYVRLNSAHGSHLLRETMSSIEERLDPGQFLRIHRSTIVNVDRIQEIQPLFHGEYAVILTTGKRLTLSRTYRDKLDDLLG